MWLLLVNEDNEGFIRRMHCQWAGMAKRWFTGSSFAEAVCQLVFQSVVDNDLWFASFCDDRENNENERMKETKERSFESDFGLIFEFEYLNLDIFM